MGGREAAVAPGCRRLWQQLLGSSSRWLRCRPKHGLPHPQAGLWRYASTLVAHSLSGSERAMALQRWAHHVAQSEGSTWRALGILTSAGCLRAALQVGGGGRAGRA
jgi:hypothetical protein